MVEEETCMKVRVIAVRMQRPWWMVVDGEESHGRWSGAKSKNESGGYLAQVN